MAKDKDGVLHADWTPRSNEQPSRRTHRKYQKADVDRSRTLTSADDWDEWLPLPDREKGSRYWLKSHGDDWIERAMMGDLMDHRAKLIYEHGAHSRSNPYRTTNLARRLQIHNSAMSQWSNLRQFPKSFASWRRLCRALGLTFEIVIKDKKGTIIFQGLK